MRKINRNKIKVKQKHYLVMLNLASLPESMQFAKVNSQHTQNKILLSVHQLTIVMRLK